MAGLVLDPWEEFVLTGSLGERPDGRWAAFEVGLNVPRQNGKDAILEGRELGGLYLLGERLLIHSAHQFDTSLEHFRRLLDLIEGRDELSRRVKRVSRSHGEEGIELYGPNGRRRTGGQRIRFRTRTKGGGRGFSGDFLALNEAMELPESAIAALLPTLSARPNPQVWYTGSAVDQMIHENGVVFARVRERGLAGDDPRLAYIEWSLDGSDPDDIDESVARDPQAWAQANPALGIRISAEHIENERRSMDARTFAVERLGVGDWPATTVGGGVIGLDDWLNLEDAKSKLKDPVRFAFDVTPNRSHAAIGVAGWRPDGRTHVEVVEHRRGTGWVSQRVAELQEAHKTGGAPVCASAGPASSLIPEIEKLGVEVETVGPKEEAQACGRFFDAVDQGKLRHLATPELTSAVKGAAKRPLGEAWAWSRKSSSVDISPLVAVTLALGAVEVQEQVDASAYRIEGL